VRSAWLIFSFDGRIGRSAFTALWLTPIALQILIPLFFEVQLDDNPSPAEMAAHFNRTWPLLLLGFLCGWIAIASIVKRRHDFGGSGWPLLADFFTAAFSFGLWWLSAIYRNLPLVALACQALMSFAFAYALWLLLECFLRKGERGPNIYGHRPGSRDLSFAEQADRILAQSAPPPETPAPKAVAAVAAKPAGDKKFGRR
jgi:uncharacterized membrane protein YhaH (DUF805 family)